MLKIFCFLLVTSVFAHDVYRYNLDQTNREPKSNLNDVPCPDGESCADGQTCCLTTNGGYGCCPAPNAVCCSDHEHCCPSGTTCNLSQGTCDNSDRTIVSLLKRKVPTRKPKSVICPDNQSQCADGQTCCLTTSGGYGCCPAPNAVCCSDHVHCCPSGTTCNLSQGTCDNSDRTIVSLLKRKVPARKAKSVICPDNQSQCSDGQTCCELQSGGYGCCPSPNAVCCSDKIHCCPQGTTCNLSRGSCDGATFPFKKCLMHRL